MNRLRMAAVVLAVLVAAPAFAQTSIVGDWDMTINSPQGANTTKVSFKQDGEKVDGLFKSPQGELPFTGTLTGDTLKFTFQIQFQGTPLDITMEGKVAGSQMTGKANFGGMIDGDWTAKRSDATATDSTTTAPAAATPASTTAAAAASAPSASSVGLAGKWDVTLLTPGGEFPATANFTEDSGKVTGTFGSPMGEVPVAGTVDGKTFKLTMTAQTPQGALEVIMTGDVDGDAIKGKAEVAGMGQMEWSAKRAKP
jgi:hypothetical protein